MTMSELESALRRSVIAEVYRQAGELDWDGLTDKQRSAIYDRWLDDPAVGGELTRFLPRERARVWLKDVPMKEYARARNGIGSFADLATIRFPDASQIARQVLGDSWRAVDGTIREKPNRCLISDGLQERLMIWGPPRTLRDLVWAGIVATADGREPTPVIVVASQRGESPSQAEVRHHTRIGQIASLDIRHTTLHLTHIPVLDNDQHPSPKQESG
jgi:hypothetical protein